MKLTDLKGIGPKTEQRFHALGIHSPEELVHYYPRTYLTYPALVHIAELKEGETQAFTGALDRNASIANVNGLRMTTVYARDMSGKLRLTWFNAPYLNSMLKAGTVFVFYGKVSAWKNSLRMNQPKIYTLAEYQKKIGTLEPVYGQTKGLSNLTIQKAVRQALQSIGQMGSEMKPLGEDFVPLEIRYNRKLMDLREALFKIHFPESFTEYQDARRRFAYDELFLFALALAEKKKTRDHAASSYIIGRHAEVDQFLKGLPYELTRGQQEAIRTIREDLSGGFVMNRLLQGDVGSGKTIVAMTAMLEAAFSGYQSALMAPTELLAVQHFEALSKIIKENHFDFHVVLVTGALSVKQKQEAYRKIRNHEVDFIIGTHALFQEKIEFHELALVITDEQHRFGVNQRKELSDKGSQPHVLAMSATPIPRTLAMLLYADMQVSLIRERPANRLPIKNAVVHAEDRKKAYKFLYDEIRKGRQAYVICPMVEANDMLELENVTDYTSTLRRIFPGEIRIELLHGKMKPAEKDEIMHRFLQHEVDILVSTTVVEVGVDVPNATVMMVENAERFGLAQLHQLRGRVGRSGYQSYCIFVDTQNSKTSKERLSILAGSNDGFYIAEQDLKLRGPGDIFGIRQSGALNFSIADVYEDKDVLKQASEDAMYVLKSDPELKAAEHVLLGKRLSEYLEQSYTL